MAIGYLGWYNLNPEMTMLALFAQAAAAQPQPMGWPDAAVAITLIVTCVIGFVVFLLILNRDF